MVEAVAVALAVEVALDVDVAVEVKVDVSAAALAGIRSASRSGIVCIGVLLPGAYLTPGGNVYGVGVAVGVRVSVRVGNSFGTGS